MQTMYRTASKHYPTLIESVPVTRKGKDAVYVGKERIPLRSRGAQFHSSEGAAREFLVERAEGEVLLLERRLLRAKENLTAVKAFAN